MFHTVLKDILKQYNSIGFLSLVYIIWSREKKKKKKKNEGKKNHASHRSLKNKLLTNVLKIYQLCSMGAWTCKHI